MLSDRLSTFATNARRGCPTDPFRSEAPPGQAIERMVEVAAKKTPQAAAPQPLSLDKSMAAVLALLVADREDRLAENGKEPRKTELVLATAGMQAPEIAPLVGKNVGAVRKAIQRGRK